MTAQTSERASDLFLQARGLPTADRGAFLATACGPDAGLRAEVDRLLRADAAADVASSLHEPTLDLPAAIALTDALPPDALAGVDPLGPGASVGPYTLVAQLGEGGFGTVYLADQDRPVRRRVAVKVLKFGMDTKQVVARFEAERQALAMMDHPNIARVFDAGATPAGRPYFAMEYVPGRPLTTYCDEHRLSVRDRLGLFARVCRAVQHAHQKGVVHRDLKPTNILVAPRDGQPDPRVIDFGIAKATSARLTDRTLVTEHRQVVGTPEYMAPEQAGGDGADVDTRADVYALGAVLYDLLTGAAPFAARTLRGSSYDEMLRVVREVDPPRPSARVGGLGPADLAAVAARRRTDPAALPRALRGDLDWVVARAMEKDRARRYETADALARDVERFLADEPVEAGPPTAGYRARKFVRRYRRGLATAAGVGLLVAASAVVSGWQAVRATDARNEARAERDAARRARDAEAAARGVAEAAQALAEHQRRSAEVVADHLVRALGVPNPNQNPRQVTMGYALGRAYDRLDAEFDGDPLDKAKLLEALGLTCGGAGLFDLAVRCHDRAAGIRRDRLGPDHPDALRGDADLAAAFAAAGRPDQAVPLAERTLARQAATVGPAHRDAVRTAYTLARAYQGGGRHADALRAYEAALARQRAALGPAHPDVLRATSDMAQAYWTAGRVSAALPLAERVADDMRAKLGARHPDALAALNRLASLYQVVGRQDAAEPVLRAHMAPPPPAGAGAAAEAGHAGSLERLGLCLLLQGKDAAAEPLLRTAADIRRRRSPADWARFDAEALLGRALAGQGKDAEAEPLLAAGYRGMRARGEQVTLAALPRVRAARRELVRLADRRGDAAAADRWRRDPVGPFLADRIARATLAVGANPASAKALLTRGRLQARAGSFDAALDDLLAAARVDPADHEAWHLGGCLLAYLGRADAHAAHARDMLARFGDSADAPAVIRVSKSVLLLPPGGGDPRAVRAAADRGIALAGDHEDQRSWARQSAALAALRGGDAAAALEHARASDAPGLAAVTLRAVGADLLAALALRHLGRAEEAAAALTRARRRMDADLPVPGVDDLDEVALDDWLACQVLRREAEASITPAAAAAPATRP